MKGLVIQTGGLTKRLGETVHLLRPVRTPEPRLVRGSRVI